jgi:hypothetical protein
MTILGLSAFFTEFTSLLLLALKTEGTSRPPTTRRYCSLISYIHTSTNPTSQTVSFCSAQHPITRHSHNETHIHTDYKDSHCVTVSLCHCVRVSQCRGGQVLMALLPEKMHLYLWARCRPLFNHEPNEVWSDRSYWRKNYIIPCAKSKVLIANSLPNGTTGGIFIYPNTKGEDAPQCASHRADFSISQRRRLFGCRR